MERKRLSPCMVTATSGFCRTSSSFSSSARVAKYISPPSSWPAIAIGRARGLPRSEVVTSIAVSKDVIS